MSRQPRTFLITTGIAALLLLATAGRDATGKDWAIAVTLHEVHSLSDDDASGPDDFFSEVSVSPTIGSGAAGTCSTYEGHPDDNNDIYPNWVCTGTVSGGPDAAVQIVIKIWDHDTTSANDHFDAHPYLGAVDVVIGFQPETQQMTIDNLTGWSSPRCAGVATTEGLHGDDRARIVFSVSASLVGSPMGDSDGDGLPDSWEVCGVDSDSDGDIDVDLPAMGANPFRKDAFVEIDWMVDNDSLPPADHSHEPWLPGLINAWNELNAAPVTNPAADGTPTPSGIALHLDVGTLYANYALDFDGDATPEISVGSDGNLDLDAVPDGIPDIGNLGALGTGTAGGGNQLAEIASLTPAGFGSGTAFAGIKTANFNAVRNFVFRYGVFAHTYPSVPPLSSGQSECVSFPPCNDFYLTFGGWPRQTLDQNRDGVPDFGAAPLLGPAGLPVDGLVADHANVFLHELGHTLGLGHGGDDALNYKPNYVSIMNYAFDTGGVSFDFDGDFIGDAVGVDFNRDGVTDTSRHMYSNGVLPARVESALNEATGIADGSVITLYSCPSGSIAAAKGDTGIDWNCNGTPGENPVSVDINNADGSLDTLNDHDDYAKVAGGGLAFQATAPDISLPELRNFQSKTRRIVSLPSPQAIVDGCVAPKAITFEEHPRGTTVTNQYDPDAQFQHDALRMLEIIGPADRSGVPTQSPEQSLRQRFIANPVPIGIKFGMAQRYVGMHFGSNIPGNIVDKYAVLRAFDVNDLPMGEVRRSFPTQADGITAFLGIGAIFADQLIARVELQFAGGATNDPVQIDNLLLCDRKDETGIVPIVPQQPEFGDLPVNLRVEAVSVAAGPPVDTECCPTHGAHIHNTLLGLPVTVDNVVGFTDLQLVKTEGDKVTLAAPASFNPGGQPLDFLHWKLDDTVFFPEEQTEISVTLLSSWTLTAVYAERSYLHALKKKRRIEPQLMFVGVLTQQGELLQALASLIADLLGKDVPPEKLAEIVLRYEDLLASHARLLRDVTDTQNRKNGR